MTGIQFDRFDQKLSFHCIPGWLGGGGGGGGVSHRSVTYKGGHTRIAEKNKHFDRGFNLDLLKIEEKHHIMRFHQRFTPSFQHQLE